MSHTLNIETEIRDLNALRAACERLGVRCEHGEHQLYASTETGHGVFLKDWEYPAVVKEDGKVAYDTYNGRWGDEVRLSELKANYGLEKAKIEARKKGYSYFETRNDQELVLRIRTGTDG